MKVTATQLRQNVYSILDEALATGIPVEIERNGQTLRIVPDKIPSKLARLTKREGIINGDFNDLIHMDWSQEWSELKK